MTDGITGEARYMQLQAAIKQEFTRLPFEPEMVYVSAGDFWMGSDDKDKEAIRFEKPRHKVYMDAYWISRYPVTEGMFAIFVAQTGYGTYAGIGVGHDHWHSPPRDDIPRNNHPVCQVTWTDAMAYCRWLGDVTGRDYDLPTEAQWEKAARGTDGRKYPWGDDAPNPSLCNYSTWFDDTTPVGLFSPAGHSPYGCADMSGNVWEWCADWMDDTYYKSSPDRNPCGPSNGSSHVIRGGAWGTSPRSMRCAERSSLSAQACGKDIGFRVARSGI